MHPFFFSGSCAHPFDSASGRLTENGEHCEFISRILISGDPLETYLDVSFFRLDTPPNMNLFGFVL